MHDGKTLAMTVFSSSLIHGSLLLPLKPPISPSHPGVSNCPPLVKLRKGTTVFLSPTLIDGSLLLPVRPPTSPFHSAVSHHPPLVKLHMFFPFYVMPGVLQVVCCGWGVQAAPGAA